MKPFRWLLLLACIPLLRGPVDAAPAPKPYRILFVADLSTGNAEHSREYLSGLQMAAEELSGSDSLEERPLEIIPFDDRNDPASMKELAARVGKLKPAALIAAPTGRTLEAVTKFARKKKILLVLISNWEPRFSLEPKDTVFFFGGNAVDQAFAAGNYCVLPLRALNVAALHDGSGPSMACADAFLRNLPERCKSAGAHAVPVDEAGFQELFQDLGKAKADWAYVCAEGAAARRVAAYKQEATRLLFADGLLSLDLAETAPKNSLFLCGTVPFIEQGYSQRNRKLRRRKGLHSSMMADRGFAAVVLVVDAIGAAGGSKKKKLLEAFRKIHYKEARGLPLFTPWGQKDLFDWYLWKMGEKEPEALNPLYLPDHAGGWLLRYRSPSRYKIDPESRMIRVSYGEGEKRTIDADMKRLGMFTGGYTPDVDKWIQEGILSRAMAKMNRHFWRNLDGTPIPGVSYNITFGLEFPPDSKSSKKWKMIIAGDDPEAGGRAISPIAYVFSTFLERTMYRKHALKPPLSQKDRDFWVLRYKWGTSKELNIRHDMIRSIIDGFSGAVSLTGVHEVGHLAGLGHDTYHGRSIMNVVDAVGLDPEWAEWIPAHQKILETTLGRVPYPKKKKKRR